MRGTIPSNAAEGSRRFVSPSELASIGCWRAYRWKRQGLEPVRTFEALSFGIAWDAFVSEWWHPVGKPGDGAFDARSIDQRMTNALDAGQAALDADARRVDGVLVDRGIPRPADWQDTRDEHRNLLLGMALHYAETAGRDDGEFTCRASQFKVMVPLPSATGQRRSSKFWMVGYIDRVMERNATGRFSIVDDKTTGRCSAEFCESFEYDLQLPLYAWAMRELGHDVERVCVEPAAKLLPTLPDLRKTPVDVLGPDGEPLTRPISCDRCGGDGEDPDAGITTFCEKCGGDGFARFVSGPRKGEVKTEKVKRPALYSLLTEAGGLNYTTTLDAFRTAVELHDLDPSDYQREFAYLEQQDATDSPFFGQFDLLVSDAIIDEAEFIIRAAAPELDRIPDIPLRDRFRCQRCAFKTACIERDPAARAEVLATSFTTREQRKEAARRAAEREAFLAAESQAHDEAAVVAMPF